MTAMKTGDTVAEFTLPDQTGTPRSLTGLLADGPVVLFFYPAAMTPGGCTKEACHFRDLAGEFAAVGASRVGISTDAVDKQARFADQQNFDYPPLLSDTEGVVAGRFGGETWSARQADARQADHVRHRHRSHRPRGDLQRVQHGHPCRQSPRGAQGTVSP